MGSAFEGTLNQGDREDLAAFAGRNKIKYFMISYTDLFGGQRAKLVPAQAIADMQKEGAGFAGFATWLDLTPAHPDMLAVPDPQSVIQLPWKPEVAWVASDCVMDGKSVEQAPRNTLKRVMAVAAARRLPHEERRRGRVLPDHPRRPAHLRRGRHGDQALLRPAGGDAPLRRDRRDLRQHAGARLGRLPERPRGRQRPVRDELGLRRRAAPPPTSTPSSSSWCARSPRSTACAPPSCRSPSPA